MLKTPRTTGAAESEQSPNHRREGEGARRGEQEGRRRQRLAVARHRRDLHQREDRGRVLRPDVLEGRGLRAISRYGTIENLIVKVKH